MADNSACYEETFPKPEREAAGDAGSSLETKADTKNVTIENKKEDNIELSETADPPSKPNPWKKTNASESLFQNSSDCKSKKIADGKGSAKSSKRQTGAKSELFPGRDSAKIISENKELP